MVKKDCHRLLCWSKSYSEKLNKKSFVSTLLGCEMWVLQNKTVAKRRINIKQQNRRFFTPKCYFKNIALHRMVCTVGSLFLWIPLEWILKTTNVLNVNKIKGASQTIDHQVIKGPITETIRSFKNQWKNLLENIGSVLQGPQPALAGIGRARGVWMSGAEKRSKRNHDEYDWQNWGWGGW